MKRTKSIHWVAAFLSVVGLCIPQAALAATSPNNRTPVIGDVQLGQGGTLSGQVVTPENAAVAGAEVSLRSGDREIARGKTDQSGYFAFRGLRSGVYQVWAGEGQAVYRVWAPRTAPPSATEGVLIVAGSQRVRGQFGGMLSWLTNPWVLAGLAATAIAVPIVIHNADKHPASP